MPIYRFDCMLCNSQKEQSNMPEVKYIQLSPGKWANVQPCNDCLQKIKLDEQEAVKRAEIAKKEAELAKREKELQSVASATSIIETQKNAKKATKRKEAVTSKSKQ